MVRNYSVFGVFREYISHHYCSGHKRGFFTLLKASDVHAVHCMLHMHHLLAKKPSELYDGLQACIRSINTTKAHPLKL